MKNLTLITISLLIWAPGAFAGGGDPVTLTMECSSHWSKIDELIRSNGDHLTCEKYRGEEKFKCKYENKDIVLYFINLRGSFPSGYLGQIMEGKSDANEIHIDAIINYYSARKCDGDSYDASKNLDEKETTEAGYNAIETIN